MNNIVRADFYRLFKSKLVYYGLTMCGILAILFNIISMEEKKMGTMRKWVLRHLFLCVSLQL